MNHLMFVHPPPWQKVLAGLSKTMYFCRRNRREITWCSQKFRNGQQPCLADTKAFIVGAQLENDFSVEISAVKGKIIVTPVSAPGWTLDELLTGIRKNNLNNEVIRDWSTLIRVNKACMPTGFCEVSEYFSDFAFLLLSCIRPDHLWLTPAVRQRNNR